MEGRIMKKILIIIMLLFFNGCTIFRLQVLDAGKISYFNQTIERFGIVYQTVSHYKFDHREMKKIIIPFKKKGLEVELFVYNNASLDPIGNIKEIKNYQYALFIQLDKVRSYNNNVTLEYKVVLRDLYNKKKIWVASISIPWGFFVSASQRFEEFGDKILQELIRDEIIEREREDIKK
jgi:hypothetical protein